MNYKKYRELMGRIEVYECNAEKGACKVQFYGKNVVLCISPDCLLEKKEQQAKINSVDINELDKKIAESEREIVELEIDELGTDGLKIL